MNNATESGRLAELDRFEVLDTPAEPLFDSLTALAAQTFDTPIALISLVDQERQWFKACIGLDVDHTAREISFCQHAIVSDDVFVVRDAASDARFRDNPLVTGAPDIRFYAGAPLVTPEGHRLGTLCIIDTVARDFSASDASRLQAIARSVMQALLLRLDGRERQRIAVIAAQQAELLKLAEEMSGVGTWSWDVASDRTVWSDAVYRIHGYAPGAEPPPLQGVLERYHPDDAKRLGELVQRAVTHGEDYGLEARIYRPDGSQRHVVARGACRRDASGAVVALVGTFQDVTEHVTAERFVRTVTDNLPGMVGYWDHELRCRFANAAYVEWFGRSPEAMRDITLAELLGPTLFETNEPYISGALRGQTQSFQRTLIKPSGEVGHTWTNYIPDLDAEGRAQGFYVLVSDVTALKRVEDELQAANTLLTVARDEAEAAASVKSEFLANVSHELRTPLTSIIGFSNLLEPRLAGDEVSHRFASRIRHAADALLTAVNDILDFSKLEAGQVEIEPRPVHVARFLDDAVGLLAPQAAEKGLSLICDSARAPDTPVMLDDTRLRQILLNLVSNAVKFTGTGSVTVSVARVAGTKRLRFEVRDTGSGIPVERQEQLFKRFSQVDASTTRLHGGTGLGLAICKGLVEAMGGDIGVQSVLGEGSVFFFEVPLVEAGAALLMSDEQRRDGPEPLAGLRLLVVDDNAFNRELVRLIGTAAGMDVLEADCGEAGIGLAREHPVDLILMDMRMPGMDGATAARAIASGTGPNAATPILAFSADVATQAGAAGAVGPFAGAVAKPLVPASLLQGLREALASPPSPAGRRLTFEGDRQHAH